MSDPAPSLVWLRDDLRLDHNPALAAAVDRRAPLVIVHVLEADDRLRAPGGAARWWLHQSLEAFSAELSARGQRLVLAAGAAETVIPDLARKSGAGAVFFNRRYGAAATIDDAIVTRLRRDGMTVSTFKANLLHEPDEIPGTDGGPVKVYGAFRRKAVALPPPEPPIPAPKHLPPPVPGVGGGGPCRPRPPAAEAGLGGRPARELDAGRGRRTGAADGFLDDGLKGYTRRPRPARPRPRPRACRRICASARSARARSGTLPAHAAELHATPAQVDKFLSELGWREFCLSPALDIPDMAERNAMQPSSSTAFPGKRSHRSANWRLAAGPDRLPDRRCRHARALAHRLMHNRVRMVVASFLSKHLLIDWRSRRSNGSGTRWSMRMPPTIRRTGSGSPAPGFDAAPYFRIFNPILQGEKFDEDGGYVRRWVPEIEALPDDYVHKPFEAPADEPQEGRRHARQHLPQADLRPRNRHGNARSPPPRRMRLRRNFPTSA
jgi:deoxyribodipyrimidine photo-lyase